MRRVVKVVDRVLFPIVGVMLAVALASAGSIGGLSVRVIDNDGQPLPGATVTLSSKDGSIKMTSIIADGEGWAHFPVLRPGTSYVVSVAFPGFGTRRHEGFRVEIGQTTKLEIRLGEEATERFLARAERSVQDLPVRGRFYQNVLTLAPGVNDPDGDGNPIVRGSRSRDFQALVGGVNSVDSLDRRSLASINMDSLEEAPERAPNTEDYDHREANAFQRVVDQPLSTFSIDVDTASYSNVRRFLNGGRLPPAGAVRIEELINYFRYDYPDPAGEAPFGIGVEIAGAPWKPEHRLVRIGIKGLEVPPGSRPPSNLVFLLDVSGSMDSPNKLPLVQSSMKMLTENLTAGDRVSIVVYAGAAGLVLPATFGDDQPAILEAVANLRAGGSTAGGAGIDLAYKTAVENFIEGGTNRVILCTDGDFNVGISSESELVRRIQREAQSGVFLTVLGFGMGNLKDSKLEKLADNGNGNYAYIDTKQEARKVLVEEAGSTLVTIAKDVKIQVEFNPDQVEAYRLIGYENRMLRSRDFNDDTKDAGEIGAGHTVTALYEVVPAGTPVTLPAVDPLRYSRVETTAASRESGELLTVKVRYKEPAADKSRLVRLSARDEGLSLASASPDFRFAAAVAAFGMQLTDSEHVGEFDQERTADLAESAVGVDRLGYRTEFVSLVRKASALRSVATVIETRP